MQTAQVNRIMQQPPTFATLEQQRRYMKERLAGAYRLFSKFGFDNGIAGHITMRDPEYSDCFWVNPFGLHFSQLKVSDLLLVDHSGKILEGKYNTYNSAAFAIHSRIHKARPDVVAAAHAHSTYGMAFSALGKLLDPISQDAAVFYEDHALHTSFKGVVYDVEEGDGIAASLGNKKAVILQNHGLLTVGKSVDETAWWYIHLERCCYAQLLADAAGKTVHVDPQYAKLTSEQIGQSDMGWCAFQPLWDRISHEQPDLFN